MSETDERRTRGNKCNLPQVKQTREPHNNTPSMEAGAAPCHLTLTLWETATEINKEEEKHSECAGERMAERSITSIHPQSLNFYCLCLCDQPFDFRQRRGGGGGSGRGEGDCIPLALACASISPPHIKAVISRGLWECKAARAPVEWRVSRSREEPGRWHWLRPPSVCLSGNREEIPPTPPPSHSVVSAHMTELTENVWPQFNENSKSQVWVGVSIWFWGVVSRYEASHRQFWRNWWKQGRPKPPWGPKRNLILGPSISAIIFDCLSFTHLQ